MKLANFQVGDLVIQTLAINLKANKPIVRRGVIIETTRATFTINWFKDEVERTDAKLIITNTRARIMLMSGELEHHPTSED